MNIFSGRRFLDVICFGLLFLFTAPRLSFAQASEMESLRATVKDMQQQMQKALDRIDQLEKEKANDSAKIGQVEKSIQAVQSAPSILNPAIGLVLDASFDHLGKAGSTFNFRSAELGLDGFRGSLCQDVWLFHRVERGSGGGGSGGDYHFSPI